MKEEKELKGSIFNVKVHDKALTKQEIRREGMTHFILSYYVDIEVNTLIDNPYKKWYQFWKDNKILGSNIRPLRNHIYFYANSYKDIDVSKIGSMDCDGYDLQIE